VTVPFVGPTMLGPGEGRRIRGGALDATLKVAGGPGAITSTFEIVVPPGYDVGAHVHTHGEELFYIISGILDILAFEPVERTLDDWHSWVAPGGRRFLRGGPGSLMHVPAGTPHAFANSSDEPATMLFQSAPNGHELYFEELAALLHESGGKPDPSAVAEIRSRHDIVQLTSLVQSSRR
jgi:mannose-6-phosphate isomerase-like protein (cupin superfamily)